MSPLSRKRVAGEASPRTSPKSKRTSVTPSPARPRSPQKKKRPRKKADSLQLWEVVGILDEKQERGVTKYLVKWAGFDPETGQPYIPTWEPADYILPDVLEHWEEEKGRRAYQVSDDPPASPIEPTQDSSPIRPPKRRRLFSRARETSHEEVPERKIAWAGVTGLGVRSGTFNSSESHSRRREIKDSYENEGDEISAYEGDLPHVEVSVDADFDRTAYTKFPSSSQPTQASSPRQLQNSYRSHPSPEGRGSRTTAPVANLAKGVIPDSQDLLGSLSYKQTETATSTSGTSTSNNTRRDTEGGTQELIRARASIDLHSFEPQSTPSQLAGSRQRLDLESASYQQRSRDSASPRSSTDVLSGPSLAPSATFSTQRNSRHLTSSTNSKKNYSGRNQSSSQARPQESWSEQSQNPSSQLQSSQASDRSSQAHYSPRFLTQVPLNRAGSSRASSPILSQISSQRRTAPSQNSSRHHTPALLDSGHSTASNRPRSTYNHLRDASKLKAPDRSSERYQGAALAASSNPILHLSVETTTSSESQGELQLSKSRSQGEKSSSSHLPSPPFEATSSTPETAGYATQPSRQVTPILSQPLVHHSQEVNPTALDQSLDLNSADVRMSEPQPEDYEGEGYEIPLAPIPSFTSASTPAPIIAPSLPSMAYNYQAVNANSEITIGEPSVAITDSVRDRFAPRDPDPSHVAHVQQSSIEDAEWEASIVGTLVEVPDEYIVPLPMNAQTRDVYLGVLQNHLPQISTLLSGAEVFSADVVKNIDSMLAQLQELCDHQSLHESDTATQIQEERSVVAKWAENTSTKCMFLAELLESIRHTTMTVCILVRPGRMADIVECILDHHDFAHSIAGGLGNYGEIGECMKITLLPTDTNAETAVVDDVKHTDGAASVESVPRNQEDMFDIIIAFDSTYESLKSLHNLRRNLVYPQKRAPMICLVVANSIEHLDRSVPACEDHVQRKINIVAHLQQIALDETLGVVPEDGWSPEKAAHMVERFITRGSNPRGWELPSLPPLEELKVEDDDDQIDATPTQDSLPRPVIKRELSDDDPRDYNSPKRQRISPGAHSRFNVSESDNTHDLSADRRSLTRIDLMELEVTTLRNDLQALQQQYNAKAAAEAELTADKEQLAAEVKDLRASFSKAGPKYQDALNDRGLFEYQLKAIEKQNESLVKKLENKNNAYDKLKSDKEAVDIDLADAKKTLRESRIPEIREMQILRDEITSLQDKNTRLEKKITSEANTGSYVQEQYQKASAAFSEAQDQIQTLEEQLEVSLRKANDNILRIHEIHSSATVDEFRKVNKALRGENENLKSLLATTTDQLAMANAARRTTRGQSMPRSPQIGQSTMSPRQNAGINAHRFGINNSAVGSRGNSPAPGELGGDGAGTGSRVWNGRGALGEVMFGALPGGGNGTPGNGGASGENSRGQLGPSRFGNHLQ